MESQVIENPKDILARLSSSGKESKCRGSDLTLKVETRIMENLGQYIRNGIYTYFDAEEILYWENTPWERLFKGGIFREGGREISRRTSPREDCSAIDYCF